MTNAEMLGKLIDLAESRGFKMDSHKHFCEIGRHVLTGKIESLGAYQSIIFDHDFAKAVFGEYKLYLDEYENITSDTEVGNAQASWAYHLQQLAITPEVDRILYVWENRKHE